VFDPPYDEYAGKLPALSLPLTVTCHRAQDAPLFADAPDFDRATQGFGWSEPSYVYTCGRRFRAPTGLDALVLYSRRKPAEGRGHRLQQRQAELYTLAMGKVMERVVVGQWITLGTPWESAEASPDQVPTCAEPFRLKVAHIGPDGEIGLREVVRWSGQHRDRTSRCAALLNRPRFTPLQRVAVAGKERAYAFSEDELAQMEAAIVEQRGVMDLILPVIIDAAQCKFGALTAETWDLVAGTLGLSVEAAQARKQARDEWWEGYARMHDGEPP
jgi:hypothetical protein